MIGERPDLVAVTRAGDVLGRHAALGGSTAAPSLLEVQAAVDEATERLAAATHRLERGRFELTAAEERHRAAAEAVEAALGRLHESDARLAAVAEQLAQLGVTVRAASAEAERLVGRSRPPRRPRAADEERLTELADRLAAAQAEPGRGRPT